MSEALPKKQATARSPLAGCLILIIALLVMVSLVAFSVSTLFRQFKEIAKFTSDKPAEVQVEKIEGREAEMNALSNRLEIFRQALSEKKEARLALSAADINLAIAAYEPFVELRETFWVKSVDAEHMRIQISFPLNGVPRLAKEEEDGFIATDPRYLNAVLVTRPVLLKGEVVLKIDDIEVDKGTVPPEFIEQMSPYRPTERYSVHEIIGPVMRQLTEVTTEDGVMVLARIPGQSPADTISDEQVDDATSRFMLVFGGAATLFLIFVGVMIFIGLRAKAKQAS
ncbi:MAG: hypothetical protein ACPGIA_01800 [Luteolibacter sp.]